MRSEISSAWCVLLVLLHSSVQARGQSSALPPVLTPAALPSHDGSSASPDPAEDAGNQVPQWTHNPAGGEEESSAPAAAITTTGDKGAEFPENATNGVCATCVSTTSTEVPPPQPTDQPDHMTPTPSAPADDISSSTAALSNSTLQPVPTTPLTTAPRASFSSSPAPTGTDASSAAPTSTLQAQSKPQITDTVQPASPGLPLPSATAWTHAGQASAKGPVHQEVPSQLNVGDDGLKKPGILSSSHLDPLLAGLLSVFCVTTAMVLVVLFFKFRQRTYHPEFHRLQDLPMDDLMEDTPLSRYSY